MNTHTHTHTQNETGMTTHTCSCIHRLSSPFPNASSVKKACTNTFACKHTYEDTHTHTYPHTYFQSKKHAVGAVLSQPEFEVLNFRAKKAPMSLLPVPKDDGQLIMVSQFKNNGSMALMTTLDDYKANPELARPYVSVHVFNELLQVRLDVSLCIIF